MHMSVAMCVSVVLVFMFVCDLIPVSAIVFLRPRCRGTHLRRCMCMRMHFLMFVLMSAAAFMGMGMPMMLMIVLMVMTVPLILLVCVSRPFVNAELHAFDVLALLPLEVHVEIADLQL